MNILGAPTNLGNRPYDDGTPRMTHLGPGRLRERGIVERLQARDLGDVSAAPYRDLVRPAGGIRNEDLVLDHLLAIARKIEAHDGFTLVIAGDCSVLPGTMLGMSRNLEPGLVYIDAHSDLGTPDTSQTGGAAGMDLAFVTGRGDTSLARLGGDGPLVKDERIVAVGVRDGDFRGTGIRTADSAERVLELLGQRPFVIHFDVDALDPSSMPFVDSAEPGGLTANEMIELLRPLVRHPNALGMEMTIYDPKDDHDSKGADLLIEILASAFGT